ncbi:hypothetical protein EVAR_3786_1 [Eumeta japonica]|uniref:Uncharacterized protein n=1 Tax=Eumeta variegata TaxID=151549 RepID=A0A4C1SSK2_EUMVA|nr:hypothetical protein EVAR_3786_1 [Eumeta japonica]
MDGTEKKATTIQHFFRHVGLCTNSTSDEMETEPEFHSNDDLPSTEWTQQFNMAGNFTENLQPYIEVDDCLLTTASLIDKEILDSVRKTEDQEQRDEEDEMDEPEPPPSIKEALEAAKLLEKHRSDHIWSTLSTVGRTLYFELGHLNINFYLKAASNGERLETSATLEYLGQLDPLILQRDV